MVLLALPMFLLSHAPARAADGPVSSGGSPGGPSAGTESMPPAAPQEVQSRLGSTFAWEPVGRIGPRVRVAGVDVQTAGPLPGAPSAWLVVDEGGGVWLSEDGGAHWEATLAPLTVRDDTGMIDDERVLLEAESARDDAFDEDELGVDVYSSDTTSEVDSDGLPAADPEVEVAAEGGDAVEEAGAGASLEAAGAEGSDSAVLPVVWFDPVDPLRALVARSDGIWRSVDEGFAWEQVSARTVGEPHVLSFFRSPGGDLVVAGTTDGVLSSLDGGASWIDVEDATDGAATTQVVREGRFLWAATAEGLFRSSDGLHWSAVPIAGALSVRTIVPDPAWEGGFWAATPNGLYRTDDDGASFYVAGRQPLRGLRWIVHLGQVGHLLAISSDGVWESIDGGVDWRTADRQLDDPDVRTLAFADGLPVVATAGAVWKMRAPREVAVRAGAREKAASLAESVQAAIARPGLAIDLLSLSRRGAIAALAPQLELRFDWDSSAARSTDFSSLSTDEPYDTGWSVGAQMCWGSCGSTVIVDNDAAGYGVSETADSLYVFDGEVFSEGEPVAAAANVAQRIRSYRRYLGEHVADAWLARARLVADTAQVRTLPLREQVLHALQLEELEARLDAFTEGAFSRSFTRSLTRSEESP